MRLLQQALVVRQLDGQRLCHFFFAGRPAKAVSEFMNRVLDAAHRAAHHS